MWKALVALAFVGGVVVSVAACGDDPPVCYAGDFRACTCLDATNGYQACRPAENTYTPCRCDGTTPGVDPGPPEAGLDEDGGDGGDGAIDAAPRKYMEPCKISQECDTGLCSSFGERGRVCTRLCSGPSDCPPPADTCTNTGFCRPPPP